MRDDEFVHIVGSDKFHIEIFQPHSLEPPIRPLYGL